MLRSRLGLALLALILGCAHKQPSAEAPLPKPNVEPARTPPKEVRVPPLGDEAEIEPEDTLHPMVPPEAAYSHGWMPLASTGVEKFLLQHPTHDGRGVIIAILDTGIDPGIPGLLKTSTDAPKVLDLRDFSNEGAVPLTRVTPSGDSVEIAGRRLRGFGRVTAVSTNGPYYAGTIREIPLGQLPASDLNGNGTDSDTLAVVVTRATDGWVLFADTDGNGSLAGERPIHDYLVARETFGWALKGRKPGVNIAANFSPARGEPQLDLLFDISSHGSHVSGIAAGHNLYGVTGFNGVAPGAQLLGLKIANSAQGSISMTGSILEAMDYAIRFAHARRLPLILNLSFGVGNEIEGTARIDAAVDSVLAAHPDIVFTIAAGNDGPGLSTVGIPGSARRSISIGATLPSSFLPTDPVSGARDDQLAYFSSRGGELAKPDLITPGVAYSTVPHWSTGQEIEQGTSMASPYAAGLAALLVSGLAEEKRAVVAAAIKQALMVTARPLPGATFVDEGTGVPDIEQAYQWLRADRKLPDIAVRAIKRQGWTTAALHERRASDSVWVQRFELNGSSQSSQPTTFSLRSDSPWASPPPRVVVREGRATVDVRYNLTGLRPPGAYTATVTGLSSDSLAGPAFRLIATVIAPEPVMEGTRELRSGARVNPGAQLRTFFRADSARPLEIRVAGSVGQKGIAFLHEPEGMPYRDESARAIGGADREAVYQIDGRDVAPGSYEAVVVAPAGQAVSINLRVKQSPLRLDLGRDRSGPVATLTNVSAKPLRADVALLLGGGERIETVVARGSSVRRIPFVAPGWARAIVVDLSMDRDQWSRFTDFGVTLFDSVGRQVEKKPLTYAFGRLQAKLPEHQGALPLELALFPGFADAGTDQSWTARAAIRLYADSAVVLEHAAGSDSTLTIAPGGTARPRFTLAADPWPLGDGFFPLAVLVARTGDQSWTREGGLPLPNPPIMR